MNTIIRDWMPRQARQAEKVFKKKFGMPLAEYFDDSKYQLMHLEMFRLGLSMPSAWAARSTCSSTAGWTWASSPGASWMASRASGVAWQSWTMRTMRR